MEQDIRNLEINKARLEAKTSEENYSTQVQVLQILKCMHRHVCSRTSLKLLTI